MTLSAVVFFIIMVIAGICMTLVLSHAATLTWDRNSEADMQDYFVYACFEPKCVVQKTPAMMLTTVDQPALGTTPLFVLDLKGKEGVAAISARDTALNESDLSVPIPFDYKPPKAPANPRLR